MKSNRGLILAGLGSVLAMTGATTASAQSNGMFTRDRTVSVKERPHPEYEALGGRVGFWRIFPTLQGDFVYDSNVLVSGVDEQSDTIITLAPRLEAETDWARHSITGYARGKLTRYSEFDTENNETWGVGAAGRFDVQRGRNLTGSVDIAQETEARASSSTPASLAEPIEFDKSSARIGGLWTFNRLRLSGSTAVESFDFQDGVTVGGVAVDQDTRDQTSYLLGGRAEYAYGAATSFFVQVDANQRKFDNGDISTPLRDSEGLTALVGANFELTNLIRGELGVGYITQTFDNPLYGGFDGLSGNARLEYFATPVLTIGLKGTRSVNDSGIVGSAGILTSVIEATADYEFRRNIIVEGRLGTSIEEFDTLDRNNDRYFGGVRATYLVNRVLGVTGGYSFESRRSSGAFPINDFDAHRLTLSLVAQY